VADDDRTIRDAADRTRINMQEDYEVRYWTQKWSVTREQVAPAIRAVGVMVADVVKKLGKQGVRGVSSVLPPACVSSSRIDDLALTRPGVSALRISPDRDRQCCRAA
jgi:hypothetical protein